MDDTLHSGVRDEKSNETDTLVTRDAAGARGLEVVTRGGKGAGAAASDLGTPTKGRGRVSIQDVARLAKVSTATVSRVINTPAMVSDATATRVQSAIDELNYRPNVMAKALMTRRSHVLGLTLPDIHGEFYMDVLQGADERARARGYHLMVSTDRAVETAGGIRHANPSYGLIDGVAVMLTEPNPTFWAELAENRVPTVALDADPTTGAMDTVRIDNVPGSAEAMALLLESCAPSRCFFVGGPEGNYDSEEREGAFRSALAEAGLDAIRAEQVSHGTYAVEWGRRWAEDAAGRGELAGSAVFAANDEIALGVMQMAHSMGLDVPGDVQIVGFDNTRLAEIVTPSLTTVGVPRREFGAAAIDLLIRRIEEPDAEVRAVRLPTRLVLRGSTR